MDAGRPVSADDLEQAVWADEPPSASRHTIATYVFRLRRLGLPISTRDDHYILEVDTDVQELERLAGAARSLAGADPQQANGLLREALASVRGRPLADLEDLPEAAIVAARLEELIEELREEALTLELDRGRPAELVPDARRLVDEQPFRERRWELLMLALYRAGRQADALDAYVECRRRLLDDLGLDPGTALRRMQQAVLAQDPALEPPPDPAGGAAGSPAGVRDSAAVASSTVPPRIPGSSTRLIGREIERRDLAEIWDRSRLVTLVGPPGAGKTRLALELARATPGNVWYVSLEQLPSAQSVAGAILDVVAPSSRAADARVGIATALGSAADLLVLDGCEIRQVEVATELGLLMAACPLLRVLVTSRERLGILAEAVVPIGPLTAGDAIELLTDRARLLDPRFKLRPDEIASADQLCRLVDRLPLGLELIARHLHVLGLDEVIERVESDLGRWAGGPVGGRAGLWAALEASVDRLGPLDRRALVALAVMVSDADLDLIDAVAGFRGEGVDSFEMVARLVDASLVQVRSAFGPTRYELLRTLAGFTLEKASPADLAAARARYTEAVLERAAELIDQLAGAERSDTLRRLDREMPHLRVILGQVAAEPAPERESAVRGLGIAVGLTEYWLGRHPAEGLDWLGRLIEVAEPEPALRAAALLASGHLAYWLTDFVRGAELTAEAQRLFAELGDPLGEGRALRRRGAIAAATDDLPAARAYLEASLDRLEAAGEETEVGTTLLHLGSLLADEGVVDAARVALDRSLAIAVATGDPLAHGHVLAALSLAEWKAGDLAAALQTGNEALLIFRELGHRTSEGPVAYRLAAVARGLGRPRAARRYAQLALEAGEQSSTRTTIAFGQINLARLDLDGSDYGPAAGHLVRALEQLEPEADRWVLVEALEAVARLLAATERPGSGPLVASAGQIRQSIHQPVSPTEAADLAWTVAQAGPAAEPGLGPLEAQELALRVARELARPESPPRLRRARS